jgi:hypothetical protein
LHPFRRAAEDRAWLLPDGQKAEQCGPRETDLLLVWSENDDHPLDEARVRELWPRSRQVQSFGPHLFLVRGGTAPSAPSATLSLKSKARSDSQDPKTETLSAHAFLEQARQRLYTASGGRDRSGEASALADLGMAVLQHGDDGQAVTYLEKSLALVQGLGDQGRQRDVLSSLGLAMLKAGRSKPARTSNKPWPWLAPRVCEEWSADRSSTAAAPRWNPGSTTVSGRPIGSGPPRSGETGLHLHLPFWQAVLPRYEVLQLGLAVLACTLTKAGRPVRNSPRRKLLQY